ncbi:MAG: ammonium transporter [Planctomycetes bacterium]|nr:ammonium transporter [Planctomycetota bacterium]
MVVFVVASLVFVLLAGGALGAEAGPAPAAPPPASARGLDTLWVLVTAFLVFFMQAGFGMVEAGFIRVKNTCNILTKNFLDYCIACVMFFLVGFAFMFGKGNGLIGWTGFGMEGAENPSGVALFAFWLFQAAFCGAAATIVAGGMAERMKFSAYLIYTAVVSALVYPIVGHWIWNSEGWLAQMGFGDFAGSTVVHSVGGYIALTGTVILGPRIGKFAPDGRPKAIPGHSIPLASLGVFLLWFGWFGFNPGSTLAVGDGTAIGLVAMNTNLAACTGAIAAMLTIWAVAGKPDLSMTMNGCLAGLVAVTAPCNYVSPAASLAIGAVAGVIVVLGVLLLDKIGVDDPVGAVPVHAMNGTWGTLAVGLFGQKSLGLARDGLFTGGGLEQLGVQALGNAVVIAFAVVLMTALFLLMKATMGLRVSREEEVRGLDIGEHGMEAYAGFQVFTTT